MLDSAIKTQLSAYLEKLQTPIELVASLDASDAARQMRELLADIAALSPKVSVSKRIVNRRPDGLAGFLFIALSVRHYQFFVNGYFCINHTF